MLNKVLLRAQVKTDWLGQHKLLLDRQRVIITHSNLKLHRSPWTGSV